MKPYLISHNTNQTVLLSKLHNYVKTYRTVLWTKLHLNHTMRWDTIGIRYEEEDRDRPLRIGRARCCGGCLPGRGLSSEGAGTAHETETGPAWRVESWNSHAFM